MRMICSFLLYFYIFFFLNWTRRQWPTDGFLSLYIYTANDKIHSIKLLLWDIICNGWHELCRTVWPLLLPLMNVWYCFRYFHMNRESQRNFWNKFPATSRNSLTEVTQESCECTESQRIGINLVSVAMTANNKFICHVYRIEWVKCQWFCRCCSIYCWKEPLFSRFSLVSYPALFSFPSLSARLSPFPVEAQHLLRFSSFPPEFPPFLEVLKVVENVALGDKHFVT